MSDASNNSAVEAIAIIGMSGRFPGAGSVAAFWQNLVNGVESISRFTDTELQVAGPETRLPEYVKARGVMDGAEEFDASFFNLTPREAELTDPQHRIFLECAWEALEHAGYDPDRFPGAIGVFAGCSLNTYLLHNLCADRGFIEQLLVGHQIGAHPALLGNDKDFLATRAAYKLNLRGPAMAVQTACSTSLVAVVQACQGLMNFQCDMALAGGVSLSFPQRRGYLYQEGAMASRDGHCRPFDAAADGTVFGGGAGVVLLRRLADALDAGDHIIAVIRSSVVNNDGSVKASYMAPSVNGQAEMIGLAHALAGVTADTISFVEAHGTGTPLGDPIEVAGLTRAFRATTERRQFCALGAVKGNIGHLEAAAGVAGLIKTALALQHRLLPPTLHFREPNAQCHFENSPFHVVARLTEWKDVPLPRRAGVTSLGVGGTNAHVVLEEAPPAETTPSLRPACLLTLSARSANALDRLTGNLAAYLKSDLVQPDSGGAPASGRAGAPEPAPALADVAFTLQTGRREFPHRRVVVARDRAEAARLLEQKDAARVFSQSGRASEAPVAFLFPGQGAQYVNMGRQLYATEPVFRAQVDLCAGLLQKILGLDVRSLLFPPAGGEDAARHELTQTRITQPALFVIEYALASLWMSWGVQPAAMIGHSIGEYVAAVLAGVMSLEDGLALLGERARLMQSVPAGGMLSVRLPEAEVQPLLSGTLAIAVVNSPRLCVVSGPHAELDALKATLEGRGVLCKTLHTSHAFHSPMMEPLVAPFVTEVGRVKLGPARIPIVSTVTGRCLQPADWAEPAYWARQIRHTVRFADAVGELLRQDKFILLEVGPGQTLATLTQQHSDRTSRQLVLPSMPPIEDPAETVALLTALGRLWLAGAAVDWNGFHARERRRRVPLPTYPFERKKYWIDPPQPAAGPSPDLASPAVPPSAPPAPPARGDALSHSLVEQVISEQLRLMAGQLDSLAALPAGSTRQASDKSSAPGNGVPEDVARGLKAGLVNPGSPEECGSTN